MAKNKQWKAIQVDWDTLQGFSNDDLDLAYYKLTPRQAAFCQAWLSFGNWESRWVNLGEPMDEIEKFVSQTELNLMEENSIVIDCDEVEDCIEVSPTVTNNTTNITNNTTDITNNTTEITNNYNEPQDGNFYDVPTPASESDAACQISGYVANQLGDFIAQIDTYSEEPSLLDALQTALDGQYYYAVEELTTALNNFFVGGADPLFPDYDAQVLDVQTQMYCENDFSKDNLATWCAANLTRGDEISDMLNSVSLATWERWQQIGQYETIYDCTSMCDPPAWCHRFEFTVGLDGWSITYGTQGANGIENEDYSTGGNYFSGSWIYLDFLGKNNIDTIRVSASYVETAIINSVAFLWIKQLNDDLTGQHLEVRGAGYNGDGQTRDITIDVSAWDGAKVEINPAAKAGSPYPPPAEAYIIFVELAGTGTNPYGSENCS